MIEGTFVNGVAFVDVDFYLSCLLMKIHFSSIQNNNWLKGIILGGIMGNLIVDFNTNTLSLCKQVLKCESKRPHDFLNSQNLQIASLKSCHIHINIHFMNAGLCL